MKIKLCVVISLLFLFTIRIFSQQVEWNKKISLIFAERPLSYVLEEISAQTGINFIYADALVDNKKISCKIEKSQPLAAVSRILDEHNLSYKVFNNNYIVLFKKKKIEPAYHNTIVVKQVLPEMDSKGILAPPTMLTKAQPVYPPEAIKNRLEGRVKIMLLVTRDGNVSKTNIRFSSGYTILDSATIDYVQGLKFIPAETNGRSQNVWIAMNFHYLLGKE